MIQNRKALKKISDAGFSCWVIGYTRDTPPTLEPQRCEPGFSCWVIGYTRDTAAKVRVPRGVRSFSCWVIGYTRDTQYAWRETVTGAWFQLLGDWLYS